MNWSLDFKIEAAMDRWVLLKMLIVAGAVRFGANQSNQQDASKMIQVGSEL